MSYDLVQMGSAKAQQSLGLACSFVPLRAAPESGFATILRTAFQPAVPYRKASHSL